MAAIDNYKSPIYQKQLHLYPQNVLYVYRNMVPKNQMTGLKML